MGAAAEELDPRHVHDAGPDPRPADDLDAPLGAGVAHEAASTLQRAEPIDRPYDRLAALPATLWRPALVTAAGTPAARLAHVAAWRAALLRGELPPAGLDFDDPDAITPLRLVIGRLGLPSLARGAPAAAEQLLRTALWHLDGLIDRPAGQPRGAAIAAMAAAFRAEWERQRGDWQQVLALLQGLGELAALGSEALRGRLARREWQAALALAEVLGQQPALVALIAALGRARASRAAAAPQPAPEPHGHERRAGCWVEHRVPNAPGQLLGVRPGRDLARMLPSEARQLRHPLLHKLWRARLAEARLLVWDEEAWLAEPHPGGPQPLRAAPAPQPPRRERGPMLLCIDTSGSMQGAPERLAKAVVLEAARTAHRERRGCRLLAFGGPGELLEHELAFTPAGLDALLDFVGQAFDGGTDLAEPIARAVERVHEAGWHEADLLLVSDGEFGCTRATLERLDAAREHHGLRVQGVLVGDRETMGLLEVCDAIHWVRDWRRHALGAAPADGHSPVHSKSLTALYFPNALSERARRGLR
jgi:uncharacterized protein with von Willebrand factor type A (vWA) domain